MYIYIYIYDQLSLFYDIFTSVGYLMLKIVVVLFNLKLGKIRESIFFLKKLICK